MRKAAPSYDVTLPWLVAVGGGEIAEKIIAKAREAECLSRKMPEFNEHLCRVWAPDTPELYEAVAPSWSLSCSGGDLA